VNPAVVWCEIDLSLNQMEKKRKERKKRHRIVITIMKIYERMCACILLHFSFLFLKQKLSLG